jgi:hypothetical protein
MLPSQIRPKCRPNHFFVKVTTRVFLRKKVAKRFEIVLQLKNWQKAKQKSPNGENSANLVALSLVFAQGGWVLAEPAGLLLLGAGFFGQRCKRGFRGHARSAILRKIGSRGSK